MTKPKNACWPAGYTRVLWFFCLALRFSACWKRAGTSVWKCDSVRSVKNVVPRTCRSIWRKTMLSSKNRARLKISLAPWRWRTPGPIKASRSNENRLIDHDGSIFLPLVERADCASETKIKENTWRKISEKNARYGTTMFRVGCARVLSVHTEMRFWKSYL